MNARPTQVFLTIPAKAEYLVFSRLVLTGLSRTVDIDPETLGDLKLAVTEACSNSVRHAYAGREPGAISIRYELEDAQLAVEVADEGIGIDPEAFAAAPGELREEGMGLAIIRAVVDELEIAEGEAGRGVRLRFSKQLGG